MKKYISVFTALVLSVCSAVAFAVDGESPAARRDPAAFRGEIKTTQAGSELQFEVNVDPEEKKVVVVPLSEGKLDPPPALRMNFLTEDSKRVPVELKTISIPNTRGPSYGGKLDIWNSSYIGFEIQFSFDRKNWKKVRHKFSPDKRF